MRFGEVCGSAFLEEIICFYAVPNKGSIMTGYTASSPLLFDSEREEFNYYDSYYE
jgi:hypothetical protein